MLGKMPVKKTYKKKKPCSFCDKVQKTLKIMHEGGFNLTNCFYPPFYLMIDKKLKKVFMYNDDKELEVLFCPICGKELKTLFGVKKCKKNVV